MVKTFSGTQLAKLRAGRGLTQGELAFELRRHGVKADQSDISRWERPKGNAPRSATVAVLASVLDVSIDELYGDGEDAEEADPAVVARRALRVLSAHGEHELVADLKRELLPHLSGSLSKDGRGGS